MVVQVETYVMLRWGLVLNCLVFSDCSALNVELKSTQFMSAKVSVGSCTKTTRQRLSRCILRFQKRLWVVLRLRRHTATRCRFYFSFGGDKARCNQQRSEQSCSLPNQMSFAAAPATKTPGRARPGPIKFKQRETPAETCNDADATTASAWLDTIKKGFVVILIATF